MYSYILKIPQSQSLLQFNEKKSKYPITTYSLYLSTYFNAFNID